MIFVEKNDFESILNILMESNKLTKQKATIEFKRLLKEFNNEDRFMVTSKLGSK